MAEVQPPKKYVFEVQVGKGSKGAYKTRYRFEGDSFHNSRAMLYFASINIGRGYKKRLLRNGKLVIRQFSSVMD